MENDELFLCKKKRSTLSKCRSSCVSSSKVVSRVLGESHSTNESSTMNANIDTEVINCVNKQKKMTNVNNLLADSTDESSKQLSTSNASPKDNQLSSHFSVQQQSTHLNCNKIQNSINHLLNGSSQFCHLNQSVNQQVNSLNGGEKQESNCFKSINNQQLNHCNSAREFNQLNSVPNHLLIKDQNSNLLIMKDQNSNLLIMKDQNSNLLIMKDQNSTHLKPTATINQSRKQARKNEMQESSGLKETNHAAHKIAKTTVNHQIQEEAPTNLSLKTSSIQLENKMKATDTIPKSAADQLPRVAHSKDANHQISVNISTNLVHAHQKIKVNSSNQHAHHVVNDRTSARDLLDKIESSDLMKKPAHQYYNRSTDQRNEAINLSNKKQLSTSLPTTTTHIPVPTNDLNLLLQLNSRLVDPRLQNRIQFNNSFHTSIPNQPDSVITYQFIGRQAAVELNSDSVYYDSNVDSSEILTCTLSSSLASTESASSSTNTSYPMKSSDTLNTLSNRSFSPVDPHENSITILASKRISSSSTPPTSLMMKSGQITDHRPLNTSIVDTQIENSTMDNVGLAEKMINYYQRCTKLVDDENSSSINNHVPIVKKEPTSTVCSTNQALPIELLNNHDSSIENHANLVNEQSRKYEFLPENNIYNRTASVHTTQKNELQDNFDKLKDKRERNREAATRCRKKKLDKIHTLEQQKIELQNEVNGLKEHVHKLTALTSFLESEVTKHQNLGCRFNFC